MKDVKEEIYQKITDICVEIGGVEYSQFEIGQLRRRLQDIEQRMNRMV